MNSMNTRSIEIADNVTHLGRMEFVLNGAEILADPARQDTFRYGRDEDDFGRSEEPGDLWGTVGILRTPTKDALTPLGRVIIHSLRTSPDITMIFIPLRGKRIYAYTSERTLQDNPRLARQLLEDIHMAASKNPSFAHVLADDAGNGGRGIKHAVAERATAVVGAVVHGKPE